LNEAEEGAMSKAKPSFYLGVVSIALFLLTGVARAQVDPGPRGGAPGAGGAIAGLTVKERKFFNDGLDRFSEAETIDEGLGPRFNLDSCGGCHAAPAIGGTSPLVNPQVAIAPPGQFANVSAFISANGPVREVRFKSDGAVHDLFTIAGMPGAPAGCGLAQLPQPNFAGHLANDIIFRIPTPVFGDGLIEAIQEATILANVHPGKPFGVMGRENRNGNDGTITRFGWKAQNKSVLIFAGEAYNVEQGISNELFPDERGEAGIPDPAVCKAVASPNDHTNFENTQPQSIHSDTQGFANFMRLLGPPVPACVLNSTCAASVNNGSALFDSVGCATCHIRSLPTGNHSTAALRNQTANLFSDLLVHDMGLLGDGITQGVAGPNEFRTAPLWGLGQRIFFLHDGRTNNLLNAIGAHANGGTDATSEAAVVVNNFNGLTTTQKQDLVNFLRSL
jgi:CxxC motif-containing protein (DUF1111 family)